MSDYKERFEKMQREARERIGAIDEQFGISDRVGEGVKTARESAKKGVDRIKKEAEKSDVGKKAVEVAEDTFETAEKTFKKAESSARKTAEEAWRVSEPVREAAEDAAGEVFETASKGAGEAYKTISERAGSILGETRRVVESTADNVTKTLGLGISWGRTFDSAARSLNRAGVWVQEKPLQAVATGASVAVGAGLGIVFTGLSSHWFFNSAIPAWTVKTLSSKFNDYLKEQERLVGEGKLSKAEAERAKFEREIAKYIGAPLLGAFSFASGAVMMTNIINPKTITGAPIEWLIGGNPVLEGVWFFGNGLVCFKTGYDLIMISLEDDKDVQRMVKEIRGLLPKTAEA